MKIPVILNDEEKIFDAEPDETLMKVLRNNSCTSVKSSCAIGYCGSCAVLLNDLPVASCKIPVGIAKGNKITTLEHFSKTQKYASIMRGFSKAGIKLCGYCNAGKIFATYQILKQQKIPTREEILANVSHLAPCCTDLETLVDGIIFAIKDANKITKKR